MLERMAHIWGIPSQVMPHDRESSARELTDALHQKWGAANIQHIIDITEVDTKHFQTWPQARRITYHTLVVGAQFLTTVNELMSTTRSHIKLNHDQRIVTWTLPASQLGTQGPTIDISRSEVHLHHGGQTTVPIPQHGDDFGPHHGHLGVRGGRRPDHLSTRSTGLHRIIRLHPSDAAGLAHTSAGVPLKRTDHEHLWRHATGPGHQISGPIRIQHQADLAFGTMGLADGPTSNTRWNHCTTGTPIIRHNLTRSWTT